MLSDHEFEALYGEPEPDLRQRDRFARFDQLARPDTMVCITSGGLTISCYRDDSGGWRVLYQDGHFAPTLHEGPVHILLAVEMILAAFEERSRRSHAA